MLAAIALILFTVVLFKMKRQRYAGATIAPTFGSWLCTVTAGLEKVLSPNVQVGFVSDAQKFANAVATGRSWRWPNLWGDEANRVQ